MIHMTQDYICFELNTMLALTPVSGFLGQDDAFFRENLSATVLGFIGKQIRSYGSVCHNNVTWTIYSTSVSERLPYEEMLLLHQMMAASDMFASQVAVPKAVKISVFLLDYPKIFDWTTPLCSQEVMNTGVTVNDEHIVVYRKEEVVKVLLHELVHSSGLDCSDTRFDFKCIFEVNGPYHPFEAIAEVKAQLMYSIIVSLTEDMAYEDALDAEIVHGLKMSALILRLQGIDNIKEAIASSVKWTQTTYTLEYFIMRTAIMWSIQRGILTIEHFLDAECADQVKDIVASLNAAFYGGLKFLEQLQGHMDEVDITKPSYSITMNKF